MSKKVAVIMGSDSDFPVVKSAVSELKKYGVEFDCRVMSAHRTPAEACEFASNAKANGFGCLGISAYDCNNVVNPDRSGFVCSEYTPAGGWVITAHEIALGIEYNGPVYVSADFLGGQFIIIDRVEFVK